MGVLGEKQDELPRGDLEIDALAAEKLYVALGRIGLYHLEVLHGGIAVPFLPLEAVS